MKYRQVSLSPEILEIIVDKKSEVDVISYVKLLKR